MVSICTTLARDWDITDMLNSLARQTYKDFEWIIVDFNYEQNRDKFLKAAKKEGRNATNSIHTRFKHVPNVRCSYPYMRDIARNRNLAVMIAEGDTIIFLDDYTVINDDFIQQHLNLTTKGEISCGQMYTCNKPLDIHQIYEYELSVVNMSFIFNSVNSEDITIDHRYQMLAYADYELDPRPVLGNEWTYTGNLAFTKECFLKLGGFDPALSVRGEDCDFGLRANAVGYPIMYNPQASSINLCTDNVPVSNSFDHKHALDIFLKTSAEFISNPELATKYNCIVKDNLQGNQVLSCSTCGAEFLLDPAKYIYKKLADKKYYIKTNSFI